MGKGDAETYLIQIVDKPHQVIALKVWYIFAIFLPIKHMAELVMKIG